MKIALAQINTTVGDIFGNRDRLLSEYVKAARMAADIVLFPELCLTGYPPRDLLGFHDFVDANLRALDEVAAQVSRPAAVVGFVDRNRSGQGKEFHNAAAFVSEGKVQAVAHKSLLPSYDVFDEDRYFERAGECRVVMYLGRRLGISICEDAWNDDEFWPRPLYYSDPILRQVSLGADLLLNISASPFEMDKPNFRHRMLLSHVQRHRVPLVYLNLIGGNDDLIFDGNSLALGRDGSVLAQGKGFEEDLLVVDPDSTGGQGYRESEAEEDLYQALVLGTRDYAFKCGFKTAVLGLSGGIDSAVTACIAAEALGPRDVHGVAMPSQYSSRESHDDAERLAQNLGISFQVIPIQEAFEAYRRTLADSFRGHAEDTTEENIQARIRGNILMALSNKLGHLVLSTGNKSELGVGYCTLYGDMAGGLAVISDLPKSKVYRLADYINSVRVRIPVNTISRPPTAELRPNQKDQDSLPPYEVLDGILRLAIEEQASFSEIVAAGHDATTVREVLRMIHQNEYKRRQAAPGLKVTGRAFGTGRRIPIAKRLSY